VFVTESIEEDRVLGRGRVLLEMPPKMASRIWEKHLVHERNGCRRAFDIEENRVDASY
jgi:hypothetical protein